MSHHGPTIEACVKTLMQLDIPLSCRREVRDAIRRLPTAAWTEGPKALGHYAIRDGDTILLGIVKAHCMVTIAGFAQDIHLGSYELNGTEWLHLDPLIPPLPDAAR